MWLALWSDSMERKLQADTTGALSAMVSVKSGKEAVLQLYGQQGCLAPEDLLNTSVNTQRGLPEGATAAENLHY